MADIGGIGQGMAYTFTKLNGTIQYVAISGGKFYAVSDLVSAPPVEVLTATDLSGASVTLVANQPVYAVTYNDQMVISDGTNTPWMWDGTAHGGITKLTNAPVSFGPPTVYYARLFFITNIDRGTIQWSEVNSANTGYLAGGFNNQWTLGQTGSEPLSRILGTNIGLYYWRSSSIGIIRGAVTSTFSTDGTHDSVSDVIGHSANGVPVQMGGYIWFADGYLGSPWRLAVGSSTLQPLWAEVPRRIQPVLVMGPRDLPYNIGEVNAQFSISYAWLSIPWKRQIIMFAKSADATFSIGLRFAIDTGHILGIDEWNGVFLAATGPFALWGVAKKLDTVVVTLESVSRTPLFYGSDQNSSASSKTYSATIVGPQQGYDEATDWYFDEIDVAYEGNAVDSAASLKVDYLTDREHYSTLMAAQQSITPYDVLYQIKESRSRFGINGSGSWIRVRIQMSSTGRLVCKGWTVKAFATSTEPVTVG